MIKISNKEVTKRKLLSVLLDKKEPVTVTELAKLINKTGRTVRSYLDEIEAEYEKYNLKIVRKTSVGVYLNIDEINRIDIAKNIIKIISEVLNTDLTGDNALLTRLVLYLRPTIIRLKYGLNLTNPMLDEMILKINDAQSIDDIIDFFIKGGYKNE